MANLMLGHAAAADFCAIKVARSVDEVNSGTRLNCSSVVGLAALNTRCVYTVSSA